MAHTIKLDAPVDAGYAGIERAIIDVLRRTFQRTITRVTPDGQRLDRSAYQLMSRLEERGDIRLSELAALVELDVSTISRQVRQIEDAGMVSRRPDPADGRATRVELTEQGRSMLASMREERHQLLSEAMAGWTQAERLQLSRLMQRLAGDLSGLTDSHRTREVNA